MMQTDWKQRAAEVTWRVSERCADCWHVRLKWTQAWSSTSETLRDSGAMKKLQMSAGLCVLSRSVSGRFSSSGLAAFRQRHLGLRRRCAWLWGDRLRISAGSQSDAATGRLLQWTLKRKQLSPELQSCLHIIVNRDWLRVSRGGCKKDCRLFRILFL